MEEDKKIPVARRVCYGMDHADSALVFHPSMVASASTETSLFEDIGFEM